VVRLTKGNKKMKNSVSKMLGMVLVTFLLAFTAGGCSCETVEPGNVGLGIDMDGVQPNLYQPGFHTVSITTDILPMSIQTQTYEMGGVDNIHALTQDQLSVDLEVTINFSLNPEYAVVIYQAYSADYAARIIHPIVRTAVRDAASTFTAVNLVDHRTELQTAMEEAVRTSVASTLQQRNIDAAAIRIENILLRNIDLPQSLDDSIAAVQQQRMQTQQRQQALETASAEAARLRTEAEGEAAAMQIRAEAEAGANRILAASLTPAVLEARRIEALRDITTNPSSRVVLVPSDTSARVRIDASPSARTAE